MYSVHCLSNKYTRHINKYKGYDLWTKIANEVLISNIKNPANFVVVACFE